MNSLSMNKTLANLKKLRKCKGGSTYYRKIQRRLNATNILLRSSVESATIVHSIQSNTNYLSDAKNTGSTSISSQEVQQKVIESDAILVSKDFLPQINASTAASTNCDIEFSTSSDNDSAKMIIIL